MDKIFYSGDQDALLQAAGTLIHLIDKDSHVKAAASSVVSEQMIRDNMPDDRHFGVHLIAMGAGEYYGCFFKGTPVRTADGLKPIEEVLPGEMVLTHKNRFRPVTEVFQKPYEGDACKLRISGLPYEVTSTLNHPIQIVRKKNFGHKLRWQMKRNKQDLASFIDALVDKSEFVAADALGIGDYVVIPCLPRLPGSSTGCGTIDDGLSDICGYYLADGCLIKEYKQISTMGTWKSIIWTMGDYKQPLIDRLQEFAILNDRTLANDPSLTSDKARRLTLGLKDLALQMDAWFGHDGKTKRIPWTIFHQSDIWKLKFIAAYFDGDGTVQGGEQGKYAGVLRATTVSLTLALQLQQLLGSLKIPASISRCMNRIKNGVFGKQDGVIYEISVAASRSNQILKYCRRLKEHANQRDPSTSIFASGSYLLLPVREVEVCSTDEKVKYNLAVEEDNTYCTLVSGHNSNRNADFFGEDGLSKVADDYGHTTFVKCGHFFREHNNRHPEHKIGIVKASCYNDKMHRVELIIHGARDKAEEEYEHLKAARALSFSMSCRVPFDRCSICDNPAKSASVYCTHLRNNMTRWMPQFSKFAFAYNDRPKFFDISRVKNPADRIAHYLEYIHPADELQKAAAAKGEFLFSEDQAKLAGVNLPPEIEYGCSTPRRRFWLEKLAAQEALIERTDKYGTSNGGVGDFLKFALAPAATPELSDDQLRTLAGIDPDVVFAALAKRAAMLPFLSFCAYVNSWTTKEARNNPVFQHAATLLPTAFRDQLTKESQPQLEAHFVPAGEAKIAACNVPDPVQKLLNRIGDDYTTDPLQTQRRIMFRISDDVPEEEVTIKAASAMLPETVAHAAAMVTAYTLYKVAAVEAAEQHGHDCVDERAQLLVAFNRKY